MEITAPGEMPIIEDVPLSGNSAIAITRNYRLPARPNWQFAGVTFDGQDSVIHAGSTGFAVTRGQTVSVALDLASRYSQMIGRFSPIRDSITRIELLVDGVVRASQAFAAQSRIGDTVLLPFDYLPTGAAHTLSAFAFGQIDGVEQRLYAAETTLTIAAGADMRIAMPLRWAGPESHRPVGQAEFMFALGAVGAIEWQGRLDPLLTFNPVNLAFNSTRTGYPSPLESDDGWGGGTSKWDLLDGAHGYTDTWAHGLAFTGGRPGYMGVPCGLRQATVDFGTPTTFSRVMVWHFGDNHIPNTYTIQYWNGSSWVEIFSTTNGHNYLREDLRYPGPGWGAVPTENSFPAITATKVRFVMDNCDVEHGYLYEFEVYND
jgi:hypothetical protein